MEASKILEKQFENINTDEVEIIPNSDRVLLLFYDENPYRAIEKTKSGLILGIQSSQEYTSDETGEVTQNTEEIACAKVIKTGPMCKWVQEGEDVFANKPFAIPVPFRKKHLYMLSEANILCRIKKVE